ncbi:MAG TPA: FtsX-like permease family protein [Planctomycetota bacterium]|nr:FtsX-like permease family protein [Planctomycetota bacterium]
MRLLFLNLFRKPLRTALTVFGVAVALFLFCFLEAVLEAFNAGVNMSDASRLVVQHKESLSFQLPLSYKSLIMQTEGVQHCAGAVWFGGLSQEPGPDGKKNEEFFPQFAMDLASYLPQYPEIVIPREQMETLMKDQAGCVMGAKIAERLNKKVGDKLTLRCTIWAQEKGTELWDFNVDAIYTSTNPTFDQTMMFFHYKYFDEARVFGKGGVGIFITSINDAGRYQEIANKIDRRFQNSPYETRTMTEKAFNMSFVSMLGNLQLLMRSIGTAVVLTMLLVSANTMMMAARERTREMGILKSIGFTDGHVFWLLIGESMVIALLGGIFGAGSALIVANVIGYNPKPDFFPVFYLPMKALLSAFVIVAITGLISGLVPAISGMRLKATEALRSV